MTILRRLAFPTLRAVGLGVLLAFAALAIAGCSTCPEGRTVCPPDGNCGHASNSVAMNCNEGFVPGGELTFVAVQNTRCPIKGEEIDRTEVAECLTSDFNGQKVGFCCGSCIYTWHKLPTTDKDAKLAKVTAAGS